jgi:mannose-6-phosphate isomerase-like protein (cupin superfamily)
MNINVSAMKGSYDAFDLGDPRVDVQLDRIPVFMSMRLDRALLRPEPPSRASKGTVQYRRVLAPAVFSGPWAYVDHLLLGPSSATAPHLHRELAEFYYVIKGQGNAIVSERNDSESAPIREGDAIPIQLNEVHSFENTGTEPLEFLIVGVSRDSTRRVDFVEAPGPGRAN